MKENGNKILKINLGLIQVLMKGMRKKNTEAIQTFAFSFMKFCFLVSVFFKKEGSTKILKEKKKKIVETNFLYIKRITYESNGRHDTYLQKFFKETQKTD